LTTECRPATIKLEATFFCRLMIPATQTSVQTVQLTYD